MSRKPPTDLPILPFKSQAAWETWLARNHAKAPGVYIKLAKKDSGISSVTYAQALEGALCWGWIDGLKLPLDATHWLQRFTPRRARSKWSKINCGKIEQLEQAGRLQPPGAREVESARRDGRWERAYAGQRTATVPDDLQEALDRKPKARMLFEALPGYRRYSVLYYIHDAKRPDTRARRIAHCIAGLLAGKFSN